MGACILFIQEDAAQHLLLFKRCNKCNYHLYNFRTSSSRFHSFFQLVSLFVHVTRKISSRSRVTMEVFVCTDCPIPYPLNASAIQKRLPLLLSLCFPFISPRMFRYEKFLHSTPYPVLASGVFILTIPQHDGRLCWQPDMAKVAYCFAWYWASCPKSW